MNCLLASKVVNIDSVKYRASTWIRYKYK